MPVKTIRQLQSEYETQARRARDHDQQTKVMLLQREADQKKWLAERKADKTKIMADKLKAVLALEAAKRLPAEPEPVKVEGTSPAAE